MSTNSRPNKWKGLMIAGWILLSVVARAQYTQAARMEFAMGLGESIDNYTVISAQTEGLILFDLRIANHHTFAEITRMDTALEEVWKGSIPIPSDIVPRKSVVRKGLLYILFKNIKKSDFTLLVLDVVSKNYVVHNIINFIPFNPTEFLALDDAVMIGGLFNYRPLVLHFTVSTGKSKVLPGFFNDQGELLQLSASADGIAEVIVSAKNVDRKRCLWLRNYDQEGTLIKTTVIEPEGDKNLLFGRSVIATGDEQIVAGVYGRNTYFARGLFVAHINASGEYNINYYNFGDLQNFFNYMKASKVKRVKERIERRKVKGKKIRFNYRFLVHELILRGDQYVMLGEAFYPTYKTQNTSPFLAGFGRPLSRNDYTFDGYKYTHAVVIGFSQSGKLLWDNSFEINDVKTFNLEQFVKIQAAENHINLLYLYNNVIRSKIIQDDQVLEGKTTETLKTKYGSDIAQEDAGGKNKLEYWYPGCFYAWGSQRITNPKLPGTPLTRKVFYISKIVSK